MRCPAISSHTVAAICFDEWIPLYNHIQNVSKLCAINDRGVSRHQYESKRSNEPVFIGNVSVKFTEDKSSRAHHVAKLVQST
jgi:hypothetical protein